MASIVIISLQIRLTNQRCGQRLGLAGMINLKVLFCGLLVLRDAHFMCYTLKHVGLLSLVVQFLKDLLKTWHFQLQGLYRKGDHMSTIIW